VEAVDLVDRLVEVPLVDLVGRHGTHVGTDPFAPTGPSP
jgi:hypothetical protein